MAGAALLTPIGGDIATTADATVNNKGGSTTATLKKSLRDRLGDVTNHLGWRSPSIRHRTSNCSVGWRGRGFSRLRRSAHPKDWAELL